jgi:regulator of extracellular matrix RemA (YlzA/DUF370 family)
MRGRYVAMPTSAVLEDLIDALEEQSDSLFAFLDRQTGEVVLISEESLALSEADPETIAMLPDWQKEEAVCAVLIETTDRYLALPDRFDVNEWDIMNEFRHEVKQDDIRSALLKAVQGNRPFRRFKDEIANHNLWDDWNRFRRHAFGEVIRDWSEENGIILAVRQRQTTPE